MSVGKGILHEIPAREKRGTPGESHLEQPNA